jgi:hypothetical protein
MSTNEWITAETNKDRYFVYRLIINKESTKLFVILDPVGKYISDQLKMIPRKGAEIIYKENCGSWETLLIWEN